MNGISIMATLAARRRQEREEAMDALLCSWHQWQQKEPVTRGFAPKALVAGDYRSSRQYDDANGALDAAIDRQIMRQVDFEVREMKDPHRVAIYVLARALTVGCMVFMSPRLPQDKSARDRLILEAKAILFARCVSAGLI